MGFDQVQGLIRDIEYRDIQIERLEKMTDAVVDFLEEVINHNGICPSMVSGSEVKLFTKAVGEYRNE